MGRRTISGIRRQLLARLGEERGQALVLAIAIVVIGMVLGLAAVAFALNSTQQSVHDERTRSAQQAADAGEQQQLYLQSSANATEYGVANSVGGTLDCVVPQLGVNLQVLGIQLTASDNGVCPVGTCQSTCTSSPSTAWTSLGNEAYEDSVFFPNEQTDSGTGSSGKGETVEFPEVASIGCHSAANSCNSPPGNNQYAHDLTLLQPTGPLNAIEAENNVTIKGGGSVPESLVPGLCSLLPVVCSTTSLPSTVIGGTVVANNNLYLPAASVGLTSSLSQAAQGVLGGLANLVGGTSGSDLLATLQSNLSYGGSCLEENASYNQTATCAEGVFTNGFTNANLNTNLIPITGSACQAGNPSTNCKLLRPSFTLAGSGYTSTATLTSELAPDSSSVASGKWTDTNGNLVVSSGGTLDLDAGNYTFCSVNVQAGGQLKGPYQTSTQTGPLRIFILPPSSCSSTGTAAGATVGSFVVAGGINNTLNANSTLSTTVNGVTGVADPSAFQVYVAGDSTDTTQVSIGATSTPSTTQAYIIYAPQSQLSVSTSAAVEGSLIGYNVTVSAAAVLQDLSLGNYPLSSVITSYQPAQTVECDNSVSTLTTITSSSTQSAASAAEAADTQGCT